MSYLLKEETKTGGTKRRAYTAGYAIPAPSRMPMMRRINRISRQLKIHNPNHMYTASLAAAFSTISNTGTLFDVLSQVIQGTNYADRFGTKVQLKRIMVRGTLTPGTTAATVTTVRVTIIRAESGTWLSSDCPLS